MRRRGPSFLGRAAAAGLLAVALGAGAARAAAAEPPTASTAIVGGAPVDPAAWSFTVAILERGRLICSGSVIAPTRVLTAAHCIRDPAQLTVIAGRTRIGDPAGGEVLGVSGAAVHPDFASTRMNDIAVLTLAAPTTMPPVRLATPEEDAGFVSPGQRLQIAGYGFQNPLRFGRPRAGILRTANVRIGPGRFCRLIFRRRFSPGPMICALGRQIGRTIIGRGACYGDSGGPLAGRSPVDGAPILFGAASFVPGGRGPLRLVGCALLGTSVYARTAAAYDFIAASMSGGSP